MYPALETQRTILSEIVNADVDALFNLFSNENVIKYYDTEAFEALSEAQELIELFRYRFESNQGLRWGIRDKASKVLIGTCGFNSWSISMRNAVIGYEIHPKYWRKGLAREAVGTMLQAGFSGSLPCGALHRVQADTIPGNEASERLLLSLGFKLEGLRRDCGYWKNRFHDLKCFGLLVNEFTIS
ncbi:MAG: GNAT family N-acetyltransferase [Granulosicoccus sp.]